MKSIISILSCQSESAQAKPLEVSFVSWRHEKRSRLLLDMSGEWTTMEDPIKADEAGINEFQVFAADSQ